MSVLIQRCLSERLIRSRAESSTDAIWASESKRIRQQAVGGSGIHCRVNPVSLCWRQSRLQTPVWGDGEDGSSVKESKTLPSSLPFYFVWPTSLTLVLPIVWWVPLAPSYLVFLKFFLSRYICLKSLHFLLCQILIYSLKCKSSEVAAKKQTHKVKESYGRKEISRST